MRQLPLSATYTCCSRWNMSGRAYAGHNPALVPPAAWSSEHLCSQRHKKLRRGTAATWRRAHTHWPGRIELSLVTRMPFASQQGRGRAGRARRMEGEGSDVGRPSSLRGAAISPASRKSALLPPAAEQSGPCTFLRGHCSGEGQGRQSLRGRRGLRGSRAPTGLGSRSLTPTSPRPSRYCSARRRSRSGTA
mgnify:CR=1 FL=1